MWRGFPVNLSTNSAEEPKDILLMKKWLLGVPDTNPEEFKPYDLNSDGETDIFDLIYMKKHYFTD